VTALPHPIEAVMTDNDLIFRMRHAYHLQRQTRFQYAWVADPASSPANQRQGKAFLSHFG
jgi:hypothetical protein